MNKNKGFTLIELLVVIAIIGILASIAMVNLNTARQKARVASAKGSISSIQAGAILCLDSNAPLTNSGATACAGAQVPVAGQPICNGATTNGIGNWPSLPNGWSWNGTCNSSTAAATFTFQGYSGTDLCTVTCSEAACTFTGTGC